jgi:hypothetical protein
MRRSALSCLLAVLPCLSLAPLPAAAQSSGRSDGYGKAVVCRPSAYWGYSYSPYAGLSDGAANLIRAQGDLLVQLEEAALKREERRQVQLDARRKAFEQWAWERDFRYEEWKKQRERQREVNLLNAYDANYPTAAILNVLYLDLRHKQGLDQAVPVDLDPEVIQNVNFKVLAGNAALLKQEQLPWPLLLRDDQFTTERQQVERLLRQARESAKQEKRDDGTLQELRRLRDGLDERVRALAKSDEVSPGDCIEAKRLLQAVGDTIALFKQPKEAAFLLAEVPPGCKTVPDVVKYMDSQGLLFADATEGSERYYRILHSALVQQSKRLSRGE